MNRFAFTPLMDLPLIVITCALFIWHFHYWSSRNDLETNVDVAPRLPVARRRVITLFAVLLILCWFFNFAVWLVFAILLGGGLAIAVLVGVDIEGGAFGLLAVAYLIREWSFGFPQIILHPVTNRGQTPSDTSTHELIGSIGTASSPLRPTGDAMIGEVSVSVASDDGCMIDTGTKVVVTSYRNGRLFVRPHADPPSAE